MEEKIELRLIGLLPGCECGVSWSVFRVRSFGGAMWNYGVAGVCGKARRK